MMGIFDQRGQHVNYQWNAAGDINFGAVQNRIDFVGEIEKVKTEIALAQEQGAINEDQATDIEYQLTKATQQAKKADPDKKSILDYLTTARSMAENIQYLAGAAGALGTAIQAAQHLF